MPFHLALGLSNCEQIYEPGGTIEGYVTFDLRESVKVGLGLDAKIKRCSV